MKNLVLTVLCMTLIMVSSPFKVQAQKSGKITMRQIEDKEEKFKKAFDIANDFNRKYSEALQNNPSFNNLKEEYDKILKIADKNSRKKAIDQFHKKNENVFKSVQASAKLKMSEVLKSINSVLTATGIMAMYNNGTFNFRNVTSVILADPGSTCKAECQNITTNEFSQGPNDPPVTPTGNGYGPIVIEASSPLLTPIENFYNSIGGSTIAEPFAFRSLIADVFVQTKGGGATVPILTKEIIIPLETKCITLKIKYRINSGIITNTFSTLGFANGRTSGSVVLTKSDGTVIANLTPNLIASSSGPFSEPAELIVPEQNVETTINLDSGGRYFLRFNTMAYAGVGIESFGVPLPCDYNCHAATKISNISVELCMQQL